jgi:tetraacyldisaccharide 4'-kinase
MRSSDSMMQAIAGRVPGWWAGGGGVVGGALRTALAPAEAAYGAVVHLRNRGFERGLLAVRRAPIPVISVGNLEVGGAGKTPVAAWIVAHLNSRGARPAIVLRGYGRDEIHVHRELNPEVPVHADRDRMRAIRAASDAGRRIAVWDDGFQHRWIHRDLDVLLIAAESLLREPLLLPRGPWREPLRAARRAGVVVMTRKTASDTQLEHALSRLQPWAPHGVTAVAALSAGPIHRIDGTEEAPIATLNGESILAVGALAIPERFFAQLRAAGARVEAVAYRDHHEFSAADARSILSRAGGRRLLVTRKDAVKLRPLLDPRADVWVVAQRVEWERGGERVVEAIDRLVTGSP